MQVGADGSHTISGVAVAYNSPSVDLGGFTEVVAPGAFTDSLKQDGDVLCLRDHDQTILLGRTKSGTLQLSDNATGLRFSCQLPNTSQAADLAESISRGDLDGVSFGFRVVTDQWTDAGAGKITRTLLKVDLFEISPCSFPAYPASQVSVRSCPAHLRQSLRSEARYIDDSECECPCPECEDGDCEDCSHDPCDCDGCTCPQHEERSRKLLTRSEINKLHMRLAIAQRA